MYPAKCKSQSGFLQNECDATLALYPALLMQHWLQQAEQLQQPALSLPPHQKLRSNEEAPTFLKNDPRHICWNE